MSEMPQFFELAADGHACFRPVGEWTLGAVTASIDGAIAYCRENGIKCLLVDVTKTTGFGSPTIAERFHFISQWAATSGGKVVVSIVARPEMILKDKFGVLIAANRGMISNVYTDENEAHQWLDTACTRSLT